MDRAYFEDRFSRHFHRLTILGMWPADIRGVPSSRKIPLLLLHLAIYLLIVSIIVLQTVDLYHVIHDFEKVTFNFCSSALVHAVLFKLTFMNLRRGCMNKLRMSLWQDFQEIDEQEDFQVLDGAYSRLNKIRNAIYGLLITMVIVVTASYCYGFWKGSTELPFAAYFPFNYTLGLSWEMVCCIYISTIGAEEELVGFGLFLQLIAHYDVLKNKLRRVDAVYREEANAMNEVKALIKHCVRRNLELMEYVKMMEYIYSRCMVVQLFVGGFLILMNGVVLLVFATEFSRKLCYQMFVIILLVVDLLFICHYASKLALQCLDVGNTAYSTAWYKMDLSTRKSLLMLMIGSRKPPKMTCGKIILLDLHTYMLVLRNILSWLMLIRELVNKKFLAGAT